MEQPKPILYGVSDFVRYLVTVNRRINGNYHRLEEIVAEKGCTANLAGSFQARELAKGDNFVSLLFYFGLLSINGRGFNGCRLVVPNLAAQEFVNEFIPRTYDDVYGIESSVYDISRGLGDFAGNGDSREGDRAARPLCGGS